MMRGRRSAVLVGAIAATVAAGLVAGWQRLSRDESAPIRVATNVATVSEQTKPCGAGDGRIPPLREGQTPEWKRDPFLGCNAVIDRRDVTTTSPMTQGWIFLEDDPDGLFDGIDAALGYGVDHIELSHGIIKNIDPLLEDDELVARINAATNRAGRAKVYLWTHELNDTADEVCFMDSRAFDVRKDAYRRALARVPDVAGVVLTLATTDVSPWEASCRCDACAGGGGPFYTPDPPTRVILLINALASVIHDELGREVWLRTFIHEPWELEWMGVALRDAGLHPAVNVISKEVPQDWQPYYPDNPTIGRVGDRRQLVELDLAGEYWGLSLTPAVMIDYLAWRLPRLLRHSSGAVARIERDQFGVLGTPNEANLFAVSQLLARPPASREQIWNRWLASRYGLTPGSDTAATLREILASTFRISMQTYYLLGVSALNKGSDIPKTATRLKQLEKRSLSRWAAGWGANHAALAEPDGDTLVRIWQEKTEALLQARANIAAFEGIRSRLADHDAAQLTAQLARQELVVQVWRLAADLAVRYRRWSRERLDEDRKLIERHQAALLALADAIEDRWPDDDTLPSPRRIRRFARSLPWPFWSFWPSRGDEWPIDETTLFQPPLITGFAVQREPGAICAEWHSTLSGIGALAYAGDSPDGVWMPATFVDREPSANGVSTEHRACIAAPSPPARLLLRAEVELEDGRDLVASPHELFF